MQQVSTPSAVGGATGETDRELQAKLWRSIVGSIQDAVFVVRHLERTIVFANPAAVELFGWSAAELQNESARRLHVDDDSYRRFGEVCRAGLAESTVFRVCWQMRRADGSSFPSQHVVSPVAGLDSGETPLTVSLVRDISEQVHRESELDSSRRRLRKLNQRLLEILEQERLRIAREMHDEMGQLISLLQLEAMAMSRAASGRKRGEILARCRDALDRLSARSRDLALELRPPMLDSLGLASSLRWLSNHRTKSAGLAVRLDLQEDLPALSNAVQTVVFRVAQESLTNVLRHAEASGVKLSLAAVEGYLVLVVEDDGGGFDVADCQTHGGGFETLGLMGIQERLSLVGGELAIESEAGRGTRLVARVPIGNEGDTTS